MENNYQASQMLVQMGICREVYDSLIQSNPRISEKDLSRRLKLTGGEDLSVALTSLGYTRRNWGHVPLFEREITFEVEQKGKIKTKTTKRGVVLTDLSQEVLMPYCGISVIDTESPYSALHHLSRSYRYAQAVKNGVLAFVATGGATALFEGRENKSFVLNFSIAVSTAALYLATRKYSKTSMLAHLNFKTGLEGVMLALDVSSPEKTHLIGL